MWLIFEGNRYFKDCLADISTQIGLTSDNERPTHHQWSDRHQLGASHVDARIDNHCDLTSQDHSKTMVATKQLIHQLSKNTIYLSLISAVGLMLSAYTLYIEVIHETDSNYTAFCDINSYISCSKVFLTK